MVFVPRLVLFDLDDTLIVSGLDLSEVKRNLFGRIDRPILETIESRPAVERAGLHSRLLEMEIEGARTAALNDGAAELLDLLESKGIARGIVTRNHPDVVEMVARTLGVDFGVRVCRGDAEPKPSPDGVLLACRQAGIDPAETWMIGDYVFDIQAGRLAGCFTVYLDPEGNSLPIEPDLNVKSLRDVTDILRGLFR